jgi:hypothetical protein
MVKYIKVVRTESNYDEYGDSYASYIAESITDWDEISDEDYEFLKKYSYSIFKDNSRNLLFITKYDKKTLIDLINEARPAIEKKLKDDAEKEKLRKEAAELKKQLKNVKTLEDKKILFEQLKKELNID